MLVSYSKRVTYSVSHKFKHILSFKGDRSDGGMVTSPAISIRLGTVINAHGLPKCQPFLGKGDKAVFF